MAIREITSPVARGGETHVEDSIYVRWVKPTSDRVLGSILLIASAPFIAVASLVMLVRIGRPVFFLQDRVGKNGRVFRLIKLRTMEADRRTEDMPFNGEERRHVHKSLADPRVDPVGAKLRAMRIDEIPQFWNVVKGDMSLVGPRPEMKQIVSGYADWQHGRHVVKPGVTGLWQISDTNDKPMHECTEIDLRYVDNITLSQDLRILLHTPWAMLVRRGY